MLYLELLKNKYYYERRDKKMQEKTKYFFTTKIIAKKVIYYDKIESTQKKARNLAEQNVENGTIVITDYQTKGIGTHERKWYSEKNKNLLFTVILYPKCELGELKNFTYGIARCMTETIKSLYGYKLDIKLPNDIMHNGKKIGGILTQTVTNSGKVKYLLIGIGFNVNGENFNEEIKNIATSLKKEFGKEFNKEKILCEFCNVFEVYCKNKNIV